MAKKTMIPLNLKAIAAAVMIALAVGTGYGIRDNIAKLDQAKAAKAAEARRVAIQKDLDNVSTKYEVLREQASTALEGRTQTVREYWRDRPAPSPDCAVPAALVGLLDSAVRDANAATSQSSGPVPGATEAAKPGG
jgi:hypothetical protein